MPPFSLASKKVILPLTIVIAWASDYCVKQEVFMNENLLINIGSYLHRTRSDPFYGYPNLFDFSKLFWILCLSFMVKVYLIRRVGIFTAKDYEKICKNPNGNPAKKSFAELARKQTYLFQQILKTYLDKCIWKNLFGCCVFVPIAIITKFFFFEQFNMLFNIPLVCCTITNVILGDLFEFLNLKEYKELYVPFRLKLLRYTIYFLCFSFLYDLHIAALALGDSSEAILTLGMQIGTQVVFTHSFAEFGWLAQVKNYFIQVVVSLSTTHPKKCDRHDHSNGQTHSHSPSHHHSHSNQQTNGRN